MPILQTIPNEPIVIAKGQDVTIEKRIRAEGSIKLTSDAAAAATSISIDRDHIAFTAGDMLIYSDTVVITVDTGGCAAGATTMPVTALPGPLKTGDQLQKLADLTGYTEVLEVLTDAGDATPLISLAGADVTIPSQASAANRGRVLFTLLKADTVDTGVDVGPGSFYYAVWKRDSGSQRPQVEGTFEVKERGFL